MLEVVFGVCACIVAIMILTLKIRWDRADFADRFPPISDEEFMARCTPGTRPEVALKVRRIVADHLAVHYAQIYPSTRFIEDLGAD